jgi:heme/copper-type cytochrome/quinol oxidase subunit 2
MTWTLAPAVILAVLALASKKVWDNYRYSPSGDDPRRARVLVVGEQFKWNFVYPGPDGKLGRYLMWPKLTDEKWSNPDGSGKPFEFPSGSGITGPAQLPTAEAITAIKNYIDQINPMGKDFTDPDGRDDNWVKEAGSRDLILPKNRPIEINLSSKDVIHDFFLPNFRVKLDAVPGMRGIIDFTAVDSSTNHEKPTYRKCTADELLTLSKDPAYSKLTLVLTKETGAPFYKPRRGAGYYRLATKDGDTIATDQTVLSTDIAQQIKDAGITDVTVYIPWRWDLVCEELCGQGHTTMQANVRIVENEEYEAMKLDQPYAAPTAAPVATAAAPSGAGH